DIINLIHLVDGLKVSQPVYNVFGSILSIGIELFFLAIKLGLGWKHFILQESIMELFNLFIAVIAVVITLFREEIRKIFFKPKK
ncbi:hypothetical protein ACWAVE_002011, partial [Campylobacter coli]